MQSPASFWGNEDVSRWLQSLRLEESQLMKQVKTLQIKTGLDPARESGCKESKCKAGQGLGKKNRLCLMIAARTGRLVSSKEKQIRTLQWKASWHAAAD